MDNQKHNFTNMKRLAFLMVTFLLGIYQMSAESSSSNGTITLSHQGKETTFAYNKISDAVDAAEDGDTIFFSKGKFEGDFRLTKKIAFIGSGGDEQNGAGVYTRYSNSKIIIAIPDNTKLTARLFEGIHFYNNHFYYQTDGIENLVFKKCCINGNDFSEEASIKSMLFDRCFILNNFNYTPQKAIARNCKFRYLTISSNCTWQFINCTIDPSNWTNSNYTGNFCSILGGTFVNCIINNDNDDYTGFPLYDITNEDAKSKASFTNCLFYKPTEGKEIFNGATVENAMYYEASANNVLENFTKEQLEANSFYGNDGTVVGCYGGKNPYTLTINKPVISSSKVHFAKDTKQVQIKMKVSTEE